MCGAAEAAKRARLFVFRGQRRTLAIAHVFFVPRAEDWTARREQCSGHWNRSVADKREISRPQNKHASRQFNRGSAKSLKPLSELESAGCAAATLRFPLALGSRIDFVSFRLNHCRAI